MVIALLLFDGGTHVLRLVGSDGGGRGRGVGDGSALAAEVPGEEEDGGAPKDGRDEGQGEGGHK